MARTEDLTVTLSGDAPEFLALAREVQDDWARQVAAAKARQRENEARRQLLQQLPRSLWWILRRPRLVRLALRLRLLRRPVLYTRG